MPESYSRRDLGYFADILICARRAVEFVQGVSRAEFLEDQLTQSAVMHRLLIAGEAVKKLSPQAGELHAEIDWSDIAKFRDLSIHRYRQVDPSAVWDIVQNDLPLLISRLEPIVPTPEEDR